MVHQIWQSQLSETLREYFLQDMFFGLLEVRVLLQQYHQLLHALFWWNLVGHDANCRITASYKFEWMCIVFSNMKNQNHFENRRPFLVSVTCLFTFIKQVSISICYNVQNAYSKYLIRSIAVWLEVHGKHSWKSESCKIKLMIHTFWCHLAVSPNCWSGNLKMHKPKVKSMSRYS